MRTRLSLLLILLSTPILPAQGVPDAERPLPAGAVMRLGETRFRPGVRVKHLAFSPDGKRLASWGNWLYFEDRLCVWDAATGKELYTQTAGENQIVDLGWGPGGGLAVLKTDGVTNLWEFADAAGKFFQRPIGAFGPGDEQKSRVIERGRESLETVAFSPDGRMLASYHPSGSLHLSEAKQGLKQVAAHEKAPAGKCHGLRVARDGKMVMALIGDDKTQSAVVWDVEKGTLSAPVAVPVGVRQGKDQALDVAPDGSAVVVGMTDGTVKIFDLPAGKERLSVAKHASKWPEVSAVKFVNGGKNVLSAGRDNKQTVWDARTGAQVAALNGHSSWVEAVAISPDGTRVATAGQDSLVRVWDATTWKPVAAPQGPRETVWRLNVSPDGKYAAAGAGDGGHVWDLAAGRKVLTAKADYRGGYMILAPDGAAVAGDSAGKVTRHPLPAGPATPSAATGRLLAVTPDGKTLLTAQGKTLVLWDWPAGGKRRAVEMKDEIISAAVSPDGRAAVVKVERGPVTLVDLAAGTVTDLPISLHWFASAAGFAPGGRVVAGVPGSGSGRTKVEAWNVRTRAPAWKFEPPPVRRGQHGTDMLCFAASPDGRRSASGQGDGGVTVYETATGQILAHFTGHRESVLSLAWTPDGARLLSGGGDHQVLVWDASLAKLAGAVTPVPAADRPQAWDRLATQPAKDAVKTMAALAADPAGAVALFNERLKPAGAADAATLDRIFLDLDAKAFAAREKASRELDALGAGATAGVRDRAGKTASAEAKRRADAFLARFDSEDMTPDRLRYLRALDTLTAVNTPAARKLIEALAAGAPDVWETDAAKQGSSRYSADKLAK